MKKKTTKKTVTKKTAKKKSAKKDFSQRTLSRVESIIGGKLADGMGRPSN